MTGPAAFDAAAATYDQDFSDTDLGRWLRRRVWQRLAAHFQSGDVVLELGCGTGEDAIWLAQRGVHVLATDASTAMLQQTQAKAAAAGVSHFVQVGRLDLNHLLPGVVNTTDCAPTMIGDDGTLRKAVFDGAFSNFGAINCIEEWGSLAMFLGRIIKPGGFVGLGVMSSFCLWETLWHGLHLNFKTAFRRFKGRALATLADGTTLSITYPHPHQLVQAFSPHFAPINIRGLGVFLPPSDAFAVIEKHPRLARWLQSLETKLAHRWPFRAWGDHYWIEFIALTPPENSAETLS